MLEEQREIAELRGYIKQVYELGDDVLQQRVDIDSFTDDEVTSWR